MGGYAFKKINVKLPKSGSALNMGHFSELQCDKVIVGHFAFAQCDSDRKKSTV